MQLQVCIVYYKRNAKQCDVGATVEFYLHYLSSVIIILLFYFGYAITSMTSSWPDKGFIKWFDKKCNKWVMLLNMTLKQGGQTERIVGQLLRLYQSLK